MKYKSLKLKNIPNPFSTTFVIRIFVFLFFSTSIQAQKNISEQTIVLRNKNAILPIKDLDKIKIATLSLHKDAPLISSFLKMLDNYGEVKHFSFEKENIDFEKKLASFDLIISNIYSLDSITVAMYNFIEDLNTKKIICNFSGNEGLEKIPYLEYAEGLISIDKNNDKTNEYIAQVIFGGVAAVGKLPTSVGVFKKNEGINLMGGMRIRYSSLKEEGYANEPVYAKVDSIMQKGIDENAFPGAQLLIVKNKAVIFHETFGYHTYKKNKPVAKDDLYDLASVTKVTAALPIIMQLHDAGKLELDVPFSKYWTSWKWRSRKRKLTLREILAHQAGLTPYIVFASKVLRKDGTFKKRYISNKKSTKYPTEIYPNMYLRSSFKSKVHRSINWSKVSRTKKYKYSGLLFLLIPELTKELTGVSYDSYLRKNIYAPLGANTLGFNANSYYPKNKIIPTEYDAYFRKDTIQSWVHDENAALMGGVSGNAGLFGTANDLAKLMQMYLQMGTYGGHEFISKETMKEFTKVQYPENENKRGLGFDKPLLNNKELSLALASPAPEVSMDSFGHAGFTGTYIWADPKNDMVFIFLSNRVYPTRNNRNLYKLNIRPALMQVFYKYLLK